MYIYGLQWQDLQGGGETRRPRRWMQSILYIDDGRPSPGYI